MVNLYISTVGWQPHQKDTDVTMDHREGPSNLGKIHLYGRAVFILPPFPDRLFNLSLMLGYQDD